jgi:hypothetical protein
MEKKHFCKYCIYPFVLCLSIFMLGCDEPTYQPQGDYISGYVNFVDTNLVLCNSYYCVSIYRNKSQPFDTLPVTKDSLEIRTNGSQRYGYYRVQNSIKGAYYVAVNWVCILSNRHYVMGTLGCDTAYSCTNHELIAFPNFTGASYDILSWADTSKRLYPPR